MFSGFWAVADVSWFYYSGFRNVHSRRSMLKNYEKVCVSAGKV